MTSLDFQSSSPKDQQPKHILDDDDENQIKENNDLELQSESQKDKIEKWNDDENSEDVYM